MKLQNIDRVIPILGSLLLSAFFVACSTEPKVAELPNTADPEQEMAQLETELSNAESRAVDVLSPLNFKRSKDYLAKAHSDRGRNRDQKAVLHNIALAKFYLEKAEGFSRVADEVMPKVVASRQRAMQANAPKIFPKEFSRADHDLMEVAREIEASRTRSAEQARGLLESGYNDLEVKSIMEAKVGNAQAEFNEAIHEGAHKYVPRTLASTEKTLHEAEQTISNHRHESEQVEKAATAANLATARLLRMVREAKLQAQKNPEELASQWEEHQLEVSQKEAELEATQGSLATVSGSLSEIASEKSKLESTVQLDKQYEAARAQFSESEAEVYKQGDKILLRLKGLSFPSAQADIEPKNFALLSKVQKVMKDVGPYATVVIEGHTDATGNKVLNKKLSSERAKAIESYLVANSAVSEDKVRAVGYGDSKPLATNKTRLGRAQNRRVDLVISVPANETQTASPTGDQSDQRESVIQ